MSDSFEITIKQVWKDGQHLWHPYTWEFQKDNQSIRVDISDQRLSSIAKAVIALLSTTLAGRYFHFKRRYRTLSTVVISFLAYYVPLATAKMAKCAQLLEHQRLDFSLPDCRRGMVEKPSPITSESLGSWWIAPLEATSSEREEKSDEGYEVRRQIEADKARINTLDENGQLLLEKALKDKDALLAWFLVDQGALFKARNKNGDTPIAAFLKASQGEGKWYIRKVFKEDKWLEAVIRQSNAPFSFESVDKRHAFRNLLAACLLNEQEWIQDMKQGEDLLDWEVNLVRTFLKKYNCVEQAALLD